MKIQIRCGVFETNSSSTHSLTMCMESDYNAWVKGETYLNESGWCSNSIYKEKQFVTVEEAIDILTNSKYPPKIDLKTLDKEEFNDYFAENEIYSYTKYSEGKYLEWFEDSFTTPNGDTVVCFGQFGYDG